MGLFDYIRAFFRKIDPNSALAEQYSMINDLGVLIIEALSELRKIQKSLVEENIKKASGTTGGIKLKKTEFVEEFLITDLSALTRTSEERFFNASEIIRESPVSLLEQKELLRILEFLENIKKVIPDLNEVNKIKNKRDKLVKVGECLSEVTKLSLEFKKVQEQKLKLIKEVKRNIVSPILRRVYFDSKPIKNSELQVIRLSKSDLKVFKNAAMVLNASNDRNFSVLFREGRKNEGIEKDITTELKEPHLNVDIKLGPSYPQKKVHIVIEKY